MLFLTKPFPHHFHLSSHFWILNPYLTLLQCPACGAGELCSRLHAGIGGLSDHLCHTAFPHPLYSESCGWCPPTPTSLHYMSPHYVAHLLGGGGESSTYAAFRVYWHRKCGRIPALISHEKSLDGEDAAMLDPSVHVNKRPFHPFLIHEDGLLCPADVLTRSRRRSTHFPVTPGYSSVAFVFYCTNLSFFTPQMYFSQFLWARPGHSEVVSGPHVAHGPLFLYLTSNKRTPHFRTISEGSIVLYRVTWVRTRPL